MPAHKARMISTASWSISWCRPASGHRPPTMCELGFAAVERDRVDDGLTARSVASMHHDFGAVPARLLGHCLADAGHGLGDEGMERWNRT
jgi:hypothetical protein